jgi:A/G-specific adenine glycosylase
MKPFSSSNSQVAKIQLTLLAWFAQNARDLPWRRTRDPYHILVAEIMLQQTQVDRVIPKYLAFLAAFPTLADLALASTADVIRMWAGLGYNRRAVNMQRAARAVLDQYAGQFPHEIATLLTLPGIGPYTAGAIACFAYEQDVAFLDTNIRRAIRRLLFLPTDTPSEQELQQVAVGCVPAGQGWAWNQAIMELGALICTATSPACWRCPLRDSCTDYAARSAQDSEALSGFLTGQLAPQPQRRIAEKRETPFVGSNRFYRGRAIEALRNTATGLSLAELGPYVKEDYTNEDMPWLQNLVAGLVRDGLAIFNGESVQLPE